MAGVYQQNSICHYGPSTAAITEWTDKKWTPVSGGHWPSWSAQSIAASPQVELEWVEQPKKIANAYLQICNQTAVTSNLKPMFLILYYNTINNTWTLIDLYIFILLPEHQAIVYVYGELPALPALTNSHVGRVYN
jgi:hypothetical protein